MAHRDRGAQRLGWRRVRTKKPNSECAERQERVPAPPPAASRSAPGQQGFQRDPTRPRPAQINQAQQITRSGCPTLGVQGGCLNDPSSTALKVRRRSFSPHKQPLFMHPQQAVTIPPGFSAGGVSKSAWQRRHFARAPLNPRCGRCPQCPILAVFARVGLRSCKAPKRSNLRKVFRGTELQL
jgi:hypothetical protein